MRETLKINFGYFWPDFKPGDNYFTRILGEKYDLELSDDPDLYFFTHPYNGQRDYLDHKCHRVFLGWENVRADWNCCDYVLDSDFVTGNPRHKRWPIWASWRPEQLTVPKNPDLFLQKKKFACMVVSSPHARERIKFFNQLSKYKKVDSGGRYLNNIGGPVDNKIDFIKDYKFVISFENSSYPGYTTEKLIEPMFANSIPIYWGNTDIGKDFNSKSFVHVNNFGSFEEAIEYIITLDRNDEQFNQMATEPWFNNNKVPDEFSKESLQEFFDFIVRDIQIRKPVSSSFIKSNLHKLIIFKKRALVPYYKLIGIHPGL